MIDAFTFTASFASRKHPINFWWSYIFNFRNLCLNYFFLVNLPLSLNFAMNSLSDRMVNLCERRIANLPKFKLAAAEHFSSLRRWLSLSQPASFSRLNWRTLSSKSHVCTVCLCLQMLSESFLMAPLTCTWSEHTIRSQLGSLSRPICILMIEAGSVEWHEQELINLNTKEYPPIFRRFEARTAKKWVNQIAFSRCILNQDSW